MTLGVRCEAQQQMKKSRIPKEVCLFLKWEESEPVKFHNSEKVSDAQRMEDKEVGSMPFY